MEEHATILQDFLCIFIYCMIVFLLLKGYSKPYNTKKPNLILAIALIIVLCVFSYIDGDYFHYKILYLQERYGIKSRLEDVYGWIIYNMSPTYTAFRIIVWGSATILLVWAIRRLSDNFNMTIFIYTLCYLPWFIYARASLSIALIMLGLSLLIKPLGGKRFVSLLFGVALIGSSWYFHQSALIGIVAAVGALAMKNLKKKSTSILIIILVPIAMFVMGYLLNNFMVMDLESDSSMITSSRRVDYFEVDTSSSLFGEGIGFVIQNLLSLGSLYLSAFLYYLLINDGIYGQMNEAVRICSSYVFIITLAALGVALNSIGNTYVLHYRILFFAMPANAVFLTTVNMNKLKRPLYKIIFGMAAIGSIYSMIYSFYRVIVTNI